MSAPAHRNGAQSTRRTSGDFRACAARARALCEAWLAQDIKKADPFAWRTAGEALFRRKCFAEIAILLALHEHLGVERDAPEVRRIRDHVALMPVERLICLASRSSDRTLFCANALSFMLRSGLLDDGQAGRVAALLSGPRVWGIELPPFRRLDLMLACSLAGIPSPLSAAALVAQSSVSEPPCALSAPRDALYALTHSVIYAALLRVPGLRSARLRDAVEGGMYRALAAGDNDLALEFLTAAQLLGGCDRVVQRLLADDTIESLQSGRMIACLPSSAVLSFAKDLPEEEEWARSFHIMLVSALALNAVDATSELDGVEVAQDDRDFYRAIGRVYLDFSKYELESAVAGLRPLLNSARNEAQHRALQQALDFARTLRCHDGGYGHFVDEDILRHNRYGQDALVPEGRGTTNVAFEVLLQ
jgi:hypothetical protein